MAEASSAAPPASLEALIARVEGRLDGVEKRINILIGLMGAMIVALVTSNGILWNAITTSERELRQELVQLERRVDDRMSAMEQRLNARIDQLDGRIDQLDRKIDQVERRLIERIHNLELAFARAGIEVPQRTAPPTEGEPERRTDTDGPPAGPAVEADPIEPGAGAEPAEE